MFEVSLFVTLEKHPRRDIARGPVLGGDLSNGVAVEEE